MNKVPTHLFRLAIVLILQIIVFKNLNLNFGDSEFVHLLIYPVFVIFLPLKTPQALLLTIALVVGLTIDMFYDSAGIHASAYLVTAFSRNFVLKLIEPVEGYTTDQTLSVSSMGYIWIASFVALMMLIHVSWYFSVEAFSFVYLIQIVLKTLFSFIASMFFILLFITIFHQKD